MCAYISIFTYVYYTHTPHTYTCLNTCTHTHTYPLYMTQCPPNVGVYVQIGPYAHLCKSTYMHTFMHICMCVLYAGKHTSMIYDTKPPRCQEKALEKPPLGMPPKAACRRVVGGMCGKLGELRSSSPHLEKNVSPPSHPDPQNKGLEGKEQTFFENRIFCLKNN